MAFSRDKIYSGTDNNNSFNNDANDPKNNSTLGFLTSLVISTIADLTVNRSAWLRTILYRMNDSYAHKTEDKATTTDLGTTQPSTINRYLAVDQAPDVSVLPNTINGSTFPFLQVTTDISGKNRINKFNLTPQAVGFLTPKPPTTIKELYVNSANRTFGTGSQITDNGDGSVLNPFGTIDGNVDASGNLTGTGGLLNYINSANLYGQNYTIRFSGGLYTTQNNLSNGNAYYFSPGTVVTYTGTDYLFNTNLANAMYDIKIYGYLQFLSNNGLFIKSTASSSSGNNSERVYAEFESAASSKTGMTNTTALIQLYQYNSRGLGHYIKATSVSCMYALRFGDTNFTVSANIEIANIIGQVYVANFENYLNFKRCNFNLADTSVTLVKAAYGSVYFQNCNFISNTGGNVVIFKIFGTFSSNAFVGLHGVNINYGSQANLSTYVIFDVSDASVTTALKIDCSLLRKHSTMPFSSSNTNVVDVAGKISWLNQLSGNYLGYYSYVYPNN